MNKDDQGNGNSEIYLMVDAVNVIPKWLHDAVAALVRAVCPALERGVAYTVRTLCGPEFWDKLSPRECILAGHALAHLVRTNAVPLVYVGRSAKNHALYMLQ